MPAMLLIIITFDVPVSLILIALITDSMYWFCYAGWFIGQAPGVGV